MIFILQWFHQMMTKFLQQHIPQISWVIYSFMNFSSSTSGCAYCNFLYFMILDKLWTHWMKIVFSFDHNFACCNKIKDSNRTLHPWSLFEVLKTTIIYCPVNCNKWLFDFFLSGCSNNNKYNNNHAKSRIPNTIRLTDTTQYLAKGTSGYSIISQTQ